MDGCKKQAYEPFDPAPLHCAEEYKRGPAQETSALIRSWLGHCRA
jgi:hypothetical protein